MKTQSLSREFLVKIGALALGVSMLAALAAFFVFQHELESRQIQVLNDYVRERARNVDRRFSNLTALQTAAGEELARRVKVVTPGAVDHLIDEYYPKIGDGTRRSRDSHFNGVQDNAGKLIYGMGAFLGDEAQMSLREKAEYVAAFDIVSSFGQASHSQYDNFYFFTPSRMRMVMFGPDRPDHLMFYRHLAPAGFDISSQAMSSITSPVRDADRTTRCTDLQHLVQEKAGQRLATACATPVYIDGQYVGAFGSSLNLSGFFMSAVHNPLPGATSVVATGQGEMIASPSFSTGRPTSLKAVRAYEQKADLVRLLALIRAQGNKDGVVISPDGGDIVAYSKLTGPDWYLLMAYPKTEVMWSALKSASWVLLIGLLAACVQTVLVVVLSRKVVVGPLQRLAASCDADGVRGRATDVAEIEVRCDEIGVLARALRSERDKVDDVLNFLEHRVRERTAELERANEEKSRFLANMSHELRTPLNGVIAVAQTLAASQTTSRDRELADLIVSSGRLLEQVLSDVLDSSKIESGQMSLSEHTFSLEALVGRISELHRVAAEGKGLNFKWVVADDALGAYRGDSVRLSQILSNLLSNAVKFTEAGEVSLSVSVTANDGVLKFAVSDSGIGFDDGVRARLFRRFEQADSSISRRFGGTGLGLSISHALVQLMGGTIVVRSAPELGSVFEVDVPLPRVEEVVAPVDEEEEGFSLEGCRILLAEDHPTNQKVIELILEPFGAVLEIVENGALALDRLAERPFDIVLMDMQMPVLDGLNATRGLREREAASFIPRTPVIMLTANAMDEHVRDSLFAGADRHLAKPVNAMVLLNTIAELLIEASLVAEGRSQPQETGVSNVA